MQTRTEYGVRWTSGPPNVGSIWGYESQSDAEQGLIMQRTAGWDGEVVSRTVTVGEWTPAVDR